MRSLGISLEGLRALLDHKLHTFFMMAGTVVGIAALIVIMAIGRGTERKVMKRVNNFGPRAMMLIAGGGKDLPPPDMTVTTLTLEDAEAVRAEIEGLEIDYYVKPIQKIAELGKFDTVFCFAVLTEIADVVGALEALTTVIGHKAFVEMALAKPVVYVSRSLFWLKSFFMKKYSRGILEIRPSNHGWMLSPSMGTIRRIIGDDFRVSYLGKGPRYDMICIERIR